MNDIFIIYFDIRIIYYKIIFFTLFTRMRNSHRAWSVMCNGHCSLTCRIHICAVSDVQWPVMMQCTAFCRYSVQMNSHDTMTQDLLSVVCRCTLFTHMHQRHIIVQSAWARSAMQNSAVASHDATTQPFVNIACRCTVTDAMIQTLLIAVCRCTLFTHMHQRRIIVVSAWAPNHPI